MTHNAKIALNPLPWVLTEKGFELSVPVLRQAFSEIASPPFRAIGQNFEPVGIAVVGCGNISEKYPKNLVRFSIRNAQGPDNETSWFRSARSGCEKQISKTQIGK